MRHLPRRVAAALGALVTAAGCAHGSTNDGARGPQVVPGPTRINLAPGHYGLFAQVHLPGPNGDDHYLNAIARKCGPHGVSRIVWTGAPRIEFEVAGSDADRVALIACLQHLPYVIRVEG